MPTEFKNTKLLFEDLTYRVNGILIEVHKELGRYAREKQVSDLIEKKFKIRSLAYNREVRIGDSGNIADFIIKSSIILEIKTVSFLIAEHYDQVKRYLTQTNLSLGLLVNFRSPRVIIKRVLNPNNA